MDTSCFLAKCDMHLSTIDVDACVEQAFLLSHLLTAASVRAGWKIKNERTIERAKEFAAFLTTDDIPDGMSRRLTALTASVRLVEATLDTTKSIYAGTDHPAERSLLNKCKEAMQTPNILAQARENLLHLSVIHNSVLGVDGPNRSPTGP